VNFYTRLFCTIAATAGKIVNQAVLLPRSASAPSLTSLLDTILCIMARTAKSSDGKSHAPIITLRTKTANNSSPPTNVGAGMNDCLSLQSLSGRSLMHLMSEESLKSRKLPTKIYHIV